MEDLRYADLELPAPGELVEAAPGVLWARMPLPFALDHVNLWLLEDGPGFCLVDTGLGDARTRGLWEGILAGLGRPLTRIVVTHFHPDHLGNARWLGERTGAPLHMSDGEFLLAHAIHGQTAGYTVAAMVAHFRRHGLDAAACGRLTAQGNTFALGAPSLPEAHHRIQDGDTLAIGGAAWRAVAGHGHSPEHMALLGPGVLIPGDMLLPRITTNVSVSAVSPEEDAVGRFLDSVRRFGDLDDGVRVLPSHGRPFHGAALRVRQLERHHAERDALLLSVLDRPRTAGELLATLFPRDLDAHQTMFAMGEGIAHLNHLVRLGRAAHVDLKDGLIRFQRV